METNMRRIRTNTEDGRTVVWYVDAGGFAITADVYKHQFKGWGMEFREYKIYGYPSRASAVADAKNKLKKTM